MAAYYNEWEPYAAQWLRNLIAAGHFAAGDVDERDIREVRADDLQSYTQCHFFAGIGGWGLALRMAGWDDTRPVWTGSCPCQPFSEAGKKTAQSDERHLWPAWFGLIKESKPSKIFGEQVAGAIAHGWLDDAFHDLEKEEYACAAAVLPALSVGSPHKRERLFFVADTEGERCYHGNDGELQRPGTGEIDTPASSSSSRGKLATGRWAHEPAVGRLAHGILNRRGRLRAYGNAIVPQVAAEFIRAAA
jgi:DNA (cytosine-5)-methyltransferase 1